MLVDIELDGINSLLKDSGFTWMFPGGIIKIAPGMYDGRFNLGSLLGMLADEHGNPVFNIKQYVLYDELSSFFQKTGKFPPLDSDLYLRSDFGVADTVEQILEYYKPEVNDPEKSYIIGVTPVQRDISNRGKGGGWRWHKWGPYIGTREPQYEYLDDEPDIDSVLVFHIMRLDPPDV